MITVYRWGDFYYTHVGEELASSLGVPVEIHWPEEGGDIGPYDDYKGQLVVARNGHGGEHIYIPTDIYEANVEEVSMLVAGFNEGLHHDAPCDQAGILPSYLPVGASLV